MLSSTETKKGPANAGPFEGFKTGAVARFAESAANSCLNSPYPACFALLRDSLGFGDSEFNRLERVLGERRVEFADLGALRDESFIGRLGIFALRLEGGVDGLRADDLFESCGGGFEGLLRIIAGLGGDRLQALRQSRACNRGSFDLIFTEALQLFKT
jgi:hypothetical protein